MTRFSRQSVELGQHAACGVYFMGSNLWFIEAKRRMCGVRTPNDQHMCNRHAINCVSTSKHSWRCLGRLVLGPRLMRFKFHFRHIQNRYAQIFVLGRKTCAARIVERRMRDEKLNHLTKPNAHIAELPRSINIEFNKQFASVAKWMELILKHLVSSRRLPVCPRLYLLYFSWLILFWK